jgi:hypothetical protein
MLILSTSKSGKQWQLWRGSIGKEIFQFLTKPKSFTVKIGCHIFWLYNKCWGAENRALKKE